MSWLEKPMAKAVLLLLALMSIAGFCGPLLAHHSYADYELDERYEFAGTITAVRWGNPHILFDVSNGNELMHIEWVTTAGADKTGVTAQHIEVGDRITFIGSRNRNPDVHTMTLIKKIVIPQKNWEWISPSVTRARQ
jgi:hypothetical protein